MSQEDSIFRGFPRGIPDGSEGQAPAETFQDEEAVKNAAALRFTAENPEGKIFLGLVGAKVVVDPKQPRLPDGRTNRYALGGTPIGIGDDRHLGTVAGNRSGKGRSGLVCNLLVYPGSCLVVDPKGDLALLTAQQRRRLGHDVHILDPFNATGQPSSTQFNPLDILEDSDDLLADAGLIADALILSTPGSKDPHWDDSARQFIEGLILHVATDIAFESKRNLVEVYKLLWRAMLPAEEA